MMTFYEWLKANHYAPTNVVAVKSYKGRLFKTKMFSYVEEEPLCVSEKESEMLMQMEAYVKEYPEVTDNEFEKMLQDAHVEAYQNLVQPYVRVCGLASDLRYEGWLAMARYIAFKRNQNARAEETKRNLKKHKNCKDFQFEENNERHR